MNRVKQSFATEKTYNPFAKTWDDGDEDTQGHMSVASQSQANASAEYHLAAKQNCGGNDPGVFEDVLGMCPADSRSNAGGSFNRAAAYNQSRGGIMGGVIHVPNDTSTVPAQGAGQGQGFGGGHYAKYVDHNVEHINQRARSLLEIDDNFGTLFFLWLYMTGTIYGSMMLMSGVAFLFSFFFTDRFTSERERDFFQLAMLGFAAMFGWVLLSMWISYREKQFGWAFVASLPSIGILALVVIVVTTGDCCGQNRMSNQWGGQGNYEYGINSPNNSPTQRPQYNYRD